MTDQEAFSAALAMERLDKWHLANAEVRTSKTMRSGGRFVCRLESELGTIVRDDSTSARAIHLALVAFGAAEKQQKEAEALASSRRELDEVNAALASEPAA